MASLGIETWIAYGTLLGWYWGKRVLPWDNDGDAHISVESLETLINHGHNMSVHERYPEAPLPHTGQYLLDSNPHWRDQRVGLLVAGQEAVSLHDSSSFLMAQSST